MIALELKKISIIVNTMENKKFSVTIPFKKGLNVIRAENTSGKSTFVNAIMYALGLEPVLGPFKNRPFPVSVYDFIEDSKIDKKKYTVTSSNIELIIENSHGSKAILKRYIKGNSKIITVSQNYTVQDYFLEHSGTLGSSKSEYGFHNWLESFMGWALPKVPNFLGGETKLYLETIFPLFFIEQKRGWSEIQANIPSNWGIKSVKKTALEFVLGMSSFSLENQINAKNKEKDDIERKWNENIILLQNLSHLSDIKIIDFKKIGVEQFPLNYFIDNDAADIPVVNKIKILENKLTDRSTGAEVNNDKIDELQRKLFDLQDQKNDLITHTEQLRVSLLDINNKIKILERDIEKYKQLELLAKLGSENNFKIDLNNCPVCNSPLHDTLHVHHQKDKSAPMTTEDNLNYLKEQLGFFQNISKRYSLELHNSLGNIEKITSEIKNLSIMKNNLQSDTLSDHKEIRQELRELIETEINLNVLKDFIVKASEIEMVLNKLQNNYTIIDGALSLLLAQRDNNAASPILFKLQQALRKNLTRFKYGGDASSITISRRTFRPELDGYDIVAESSASDYIRIIWAYTLALLELAKDDSLPVKHAGFVVFDEPRQHEANKESLEGLFAYASRTFSQSGQVIISTSYKGLENIPMTVEPIYFDDYLLQMES